MNEGEVIIEFFLNQKEVSVGFFFKRQIKEKLWPGGRNSNSLMFQGTASKGAGIFYGASQSKEG